VPWSAPGLRRKRPRRPRTAGKVSTIGSRWVMLLTLAAVTCATSGTPRASVMRWCLEPALRRSLRFGPVSFPAHRAHRAAVDDRPALVEAAATAQFSEDRFIEPLPHTRALPPDQAPPACAARAASHLARQHLPGNAGPDDEEDTGQDGAVRNGRPTMSVPTFGTPLRQQRFRSRAQIASSMRA
jgi:hypothetical protein